MMLNFGAGELFAQGINDAFGNPVSHATPIRIAGLQEFSLDIQTELKEFYGSGRFALAAAQGKSKISGKAKGAILNGAALNTLIFGSGYATGEMRAVYADQIGSRIPASGAFTVQAAPPSNGRYAQDLGVVGENGNALVKVAANPQAGQYAANANGLYTFAEADKGKTVYISYNYTFTLPDAKRIDLQNLTMGTNATFKLIYQGQFKGKKALIELYSVTAGKLGLFHSKSDDFSVPEVDFQASTDDSGMRVGSIWLTE